MPIYEYECKSCKEIFEVVQSITDDPSAVCQKCNTISNNKLISGSSFILKGGCWAKDQYSKK